MIRVGLRSLLVCILAASLATACEDAFEPIASTELRFSVFGYLDASADTQWIRVMPIRPLRLTTPDSFGIRVTLEHLGTGRTVELRDSIFRFERVGDDVGSEGVYVHDFWTTERIEPGASYRFEVRRDGEPAAEAVVDLPADYDVEVWILQYTPRTADNLRITGSKHLPFIMKYTDFFDGCGSGVDTVAYEGRSADDGMHAITIPRTPMEPREGCGTAGIERQAFWIVGSESEWPSGEDYSARGLSIEDRASNVENAVGFLGGVLTKVVPYEECGFVRGDVPAPEYCRLRYGPESAAIGGTIMETRCHDGAIDSVTVRMEELDAQPGSLAKIRTAVTDRAGRFAIGALEAGRRYAVLVRAKPIPIFGTGEIDIYNLHRDTLMFTPGERKQYDVGLRRLTNCDQL